MNLSNDLVIAANIGFALALIAGYGVALAKRAAPQKGAVAPAAAGWLAKGRHHQRRLFRDAI